jgi:phospholipid/cholesterol/gamma-HCH transport system permease protein
MVVERVGRSAIRGAEEAGTLALQLWAALLTLPRIMPFAASRRRWRTAVQQMLSIGAEALPMAGIMSFCVGYVLALQSAAELRRFSVTHLRSFRRCAARTPRGQRPRDHAPPEIF